MISLENKKKKKKILFLLVSKVRFSLQDIELNSSCSTERS